MKKHLLPIFFLLICLSGSVRAQPPIQQFWALNKNIPLLLDKAAAVGGASFAYSLRKIRRQYEGFAIRLRRTDNAEADVAFYGAGIVSTNSIVTVAVAGGGLTVGSTMTLNAFKGTQNLYVSIWYDQGFNAYHAKQTNASLQPEFLFNTAGTANSKPSLAFYGSQYLFVGQPLQNLLTEGNGTLMLALKATASNNQFSFGYYGSDNWRWTSHLNWNDGNCFFDAAETCCVTPRSFNNSASLNIWRQYAFIRGQKRKLVRVSAATKLEGTPPSSGRTGGDFGIGTAFNKPANSPNFSGYLAEVVMYPKDLTLEQLGLVEPDQIMFWNL